MNDPYKLQQEIEQTRNALKSKESQLEHIQRSCQHQWGSVVYAPIHHEAYTVPGDEPGTMGVDFRGPCYVPSETIRQWKRTCSKCNLTQTTQYTKKQTVSGSIAGTTAEQEVPEF